MTDWKWRYCVGMSAAIVIVGIIECCGVFSVTGDPLTFGIGVTFSGLILFLISFWGFYID